MLGREKSFAIMERALSFSESDQMHLVLMGHDHFMTRYANSEIHQNTQEEDETLFIKSIIGKRMGVSSVNSFTDESLRAAVKGAETAARLQDELPDPIVLAKPVDTPEFSAHVDRTVEINAEEKALVIQDMISRAHGDRVSLSGVFYNGISEVAVMNTNGVRKYFSDTRAGLTVIASGADASGYAVGDSRDVDAIDHTKLIDEALVATKPMERTITLDPGEYPVILEEYAVAEMLLYFAMMGFTAEGIEEKTSFVINNRDKQVFPEYISLYDDGLNPEGFVMPFDYEGSPKRRLDFIKRGTVTGDVATNMYFAQKWNTESSGHGLPPSSGMSDTIPFHMFMDSGELEEEELFEKMGTGVYVKRFHYLTTVHPLKTILSGMTRDGVFWVENGKIAARITNMRFTQSVIDVLKNTRAMTKKRKFLWMRDFSVDFPFTMVVPKIYVEKFNFTGTTEF